MGYHSVKVRRELDVLHRVRACLKVQQRVDEHGKDGDVLVHFTTLERDDLDTFALTVLLLVSEGLV